MSLFGNDLSKAVVLFLGFGSSSFPQQDAAALSAKFGPAKGTELASQVADLVEEMRGLDIDWSAHSLSSAGALVQKQMHALRPDLSNAALRALAWKFTYDWR